jgi:hypothetical protein
MAIGRHSSMAIDSVILLWTSTTLPSFEVALQRNVI